MISEILKDGKIIQCDVGEINHFDNFCQKICLRRIICDARKQKEQVLFS